MTNNSDVVFPPAARRAQEQRGSAKAYAGRVEEGFPDTITPDLAQFIERMDTAFLGTVTENGAPYIQHRGGPRGFIKIVDEQTLGFADYRGNRQYITISNIENNDRAFLFLFEPATRSRIKLWGRLKAVEGDAALIGKLFDQGYKAKPERVLLFTIEAWDVNCSQHITERFTKEEIASAVSQIQQKIVALETENAQLRKALSEASEKR
ncbi:MAG: pyridoxamine 5'-phosphate oxidase family protein [Xanthobacteraceae bacterium]|nr:pyridoxamine 5'-phosphate oxidase family protein [Xanthobacteraceae bacterium]